MTDTQERLKELDEIESELGMARRSGLPRTCGWTDRHADKLIKELRASIEQNEKLQVRVAETEAKLNACLASFNEPDKLAFDIAFSHGLEAGRGLKTN